MTLFDHAKGQRLKQEGMQAAAWAFDEPIARARSIAIMLAQRNGTTCMDDVYKYLHEHLPSLLEEIPPNGYGSIFKTSKLRPTGQYRQSERVSRHASVQQIWAYNG